MYGIVPDNNAAHAIAMIDVIPKEPATEESLLI
jgi:hypothetical protein